jgi:CheY-like chemotaxis protein
MQNNFILIAENDSDDQLFFRTALGECNTDLVPVFFQNGEELLQYINNGVTQLPAAIFLDLNMPKMNGMEALLEIKRRPQLDKVPVIMISTSNNPYEIDKCRTIGASDFMVKPNTFRQLSDSLRTMLSNYVCSLLTPFVQRSSHAE